MRHQLHQLLCCVTGLLSNELCHLCSAKTLARLISGIAKAIGVEEQHVAGLHFCLLTLKVPAGKCTDGFVALDGQRLATQERCLMPGIAVVQATCRKVEDTYEHGDEIALRILFAEVAVHRVNDGCGIVATTRFTAEHRLHHRHEQG